MGKEGNRTRVSVRERWIGPACMVSPFSMSEVYSLTRTMDLCHNNTKKPIFSNGIDTNHVTFVNTVYTIFEKCIL